MTDQEDYASFLSEAGFPIDVIRTLCVNEADQIPMPAGFAVEVGPSLIEGQGLIALADFYSGALIAPALINGMRTPAGRFTNHSATPNARMEYTTADLVDVIATRDIRAGEEITVSYRQVNLMVTSRLSGA